MTTGISIPLFQHKINSTSVCLYKNMQWWNCQHLYL